MVHIIHFTTVHARTDARIRVKQVATLARHFDADVPLFVQDGKGGETDSEYGVNIRDTGAPERGRLRRMIFGGLRMYRAVSRARPQIAHFHDPELIPWAILLRLHGIKVIYDVHEDLPRQIMSKDWVPKLFRWPLGRGAETMEWLATRVFNGIVAATPVIGARFPARKTVLVQNFPSLAEFSCGDAQPYVSRPASFGYVGGITGIRGSLEMVRATDILTTRGRDVRLELAGAVSSSSHESELRSEMGWQHVRHHGVLDRKGVGALLGAVRGGLVVLQPTVNYLVSLPVKMFEYMAAGLPVIASDFPLWRQIVDGAGCGLLVNAQDPKSIADAMQWILDHPTEAEAMGKRGRAAVLETYNWDREAEKLIGLYVKLLPTLERSAR